MTQTVTDSLEYALTVTTEKMRGILKEKGTVRVAIDGRCGSGKSTFARLLARHFDCTVFYMDDFYLPFEKRTEKRLNEAGGNVDRERFFSQVLGKAVRGERVLYSPFDCSIGVTKTPVRIKPKNVVITEGSYSCHPDLFEYYDLHIFLTVPPEIQEERILKREGEEKAMQYKIKWIPMEEKYLKELKIQEKCDIILNNL